MHYEFNGKMYNMLHIHEHNYPNYEKLLENFEICDRSVISKNLEELEYSSLADEGMHGFFISNDNFKTLLAFVIIDLDCKNSSEKIKFSDYGLNIENCVEISLFCSNQASRIPKLATTFLQSILENITFIKPSSTTAVGVPANRNMEGLLDFYVKLLKFEIVERTPNFAIIKRDIRPVPSVMPRGEAAEMPPKPPFNSMVPEISTPMDVAPHPPSGGVSKRNKRKKIKRKKTKRRNYSFK
jgi:hypothetical protein